VASDPILLSAFRTCLREVLQEESGYAIEPDYVKVSISPATDTVQIKVLPMRRLDAARVVEIVTSSSGIAATGTANAFAKRVTERCAGAPGVEGGPPAEAAPLAAMFLAGATAMEVQEVGAPMLAEVIYKLTGTNEAQKFAAGALKNLVIGEFQHQDMVVAEGAVPALVDLLSPHVPFGDLFQKIDRDSGGGISWGELASGLLALGYNHPVGGIWQQLDRDQSGSILWEEFVEAFDDEFDAWLERLRSPEPPEEEQLSPLAKFLNFLMERFDCTPLQEQATGALLTIATNNEEAITEVIKRGVVPPLLGLVRSGAPQVRQLAYGVLKEVAMEWCVGMVKELEGCSPGRRAEIVDLLRKLAGTGIDQRRIVFRAGAVQPLVELLGLGPLGMQAQVAGTLYQVMLQCPEHEKAVAISGAVPKLLALLASKFRPLQAEAMRCVKAFVHNSALHESKVVEAGGIGVMVTLFRSSASCTTYTHAIDNLLKFAETPAYLREVKKANAVQALTELLPNIRDDAGPASERFRTRADEAIEILGLS